MEDEIYKVFYENEVLFLSNSYDYTTSSTINMMKSFDLFYYKNDYLWYRLKKKVNLIDNKNVLKSYSEELWLIRLFENGEHINKICTDTCIDEKTFYKYRDQDRLGELVEELLYDSFDSDISYSSCYESEE